MTTGIPSFTASFKGLGCKPSPPDPRDIPLSLAELTGSTDLTVPPPMLPSVDLRPLFPLIADQGQIGACTAYAITGAFEYQRLKQKLPAFTGSKLYTYWYERAREGTTNTDAGAYPRDGFKSICNEGMCPQSVWTDNPASVLVSPHAAVGETPADFAAHHHRGVTYRTVSLDAQSIKAALSAGFAVVFGFNVYSSFYRTGIDGLVPVPVLGQETLEGGHCVVIVGYREDGSYIVRNSWGEGWGDGGYCYFPASWFQLGISFDGWTWHAALS
jgi:C1A family cysteine protease